MKKVFVIVLHFKGKDLTFDCLSSLRKLKHKNFQIQVLVVVNNPQEKLSGLAAKFPAVVFLETNQNLGFAEGNNWGIRYALENKADFVVLLNNDTYVAPDFLIFLIGEAEKQKKGGIFSPKIYFAPGYEFHQKTYQKTDQGKVIWFAGGTIDWSNIATPHRGVDEIDHGQYDEIVEIEFASFAAVLIKKQVFEKIGLLDSRFFLYYEDADFCQRAKMAGFKLFYVPQSLVWHQVAASSKIGGRLHDYFMVRNQLLFGLHFAPWRTKLALIRQSVRFLLFGRPWQKKGAIDFYLRKFGKGSWNGK